MNKAFVRLTALGFLGVVVFIATGAVEILTGHGHDPVPTAWVIEAVASFAVLLIGVFGFFVSDL